MRFSGGIPPLSSCLGAASGESEWLYSFNQRFSVAAAEAAAAVIAQHSSTPGMVREEVKGNGMAPRMTVLVEDGRRGAHLLQVKFSP